MKKFHVFILILVNSCYTTFGCGFYPYGENVRFCFFSPANFNYSFFAEFNYSSGLFEPNENGVYKTTDISSNEKLWLEYCKGKVNIAAVRKLLQKLVASDINMTSQNSMLRFLYAVKDSDAINYLKFAKNCEQLNCFYEDPWERDERTFEPKRTKLINKAIWSSENVKSKELSLRYTFLAIRLAFYDGDFMKIRSLYDRVFKLHQDKNILDYWSLYFRSYAEKNYALSNFWAAQVFAHAPDKRFAVYNQLDKNIPIAEMLKYAKTDEEKANVYLLKNIKKADQSLEGLKLIYAGNPSSEGLGFLLLREINKIEDWVLTPYYSLFTPSLANYTWGNEEPTVRVILERAENDRLYAGKVLKFVESVNLNKVENPILWRIAKAELLFLTKKYSESLIEITDLEQKISNSNPLYNQLQQLKSLCLTSNQEYGKAVIKEEVQQAILKNKQDYKFIFAIGRELERKGNTIAALLLYSKLSLSEEDWDGKEYNVVYWRKENSLSQGYYSDYYSNYFGYANAFYTPEQIEELINDINMQRHTISESEFDIWEYSQLKKDYYRLYDLLGTKYIRQNKLEKAVTAFDKVKNIYWQNNYGNWERGSNDDYYSNYGFNVFDKNPFISLKYTNDFIPEIKTSRLTKASVTRQLIRYLAKANDDSEKDRDYYYFLVANCYYNMSYYGNAWMMRRFYRSGSGAPDVDVEDDKEYRSCGLAKYYYREAMNNAKSLKFRALCLRMIAGCQDGAQRYALGNSYDNVLNYNESTDFAKNGYYRQLKKEYPDDYEKLTSDCTFFGDYFKARR